MTQSAKALAALEITVAVAEAIREAREIPSGTVYAAVMGRMSMESYNNVIAHLKNTGLVQESRQHLLTWTGPRF